MFTILGSTGFIGKKLVGALRQEHHEVYTPLRGDTEIFDRELGDVIYSIGLTADFRSRPFDTVKAHVCLLRRLLQRARFRTFLYLSSTRVYGRAARAEESQRLTVDPLEPEDLYNISKLMGESLCMATQRAAVRIVRLSNVYGSNMGSQNFLDSVLREAVLERRVRLRSALDSAKDYVSISDVAELLPRIAASGRARLYNVASGRNVSNRELMEGLSSVVAPLAVEVEERAPTAIFPQISIDRIRQEFGFTPRHLLTELPELVKELRKTIS